MVSDCSGFRASRCRKNIVKGHESSLDGGCGSVGVGLRKANEKLGVISILPLNKKKLHSHLEVNDYTGICTGITIKTFPFICC